MGTELSLRQQRQHPFFIVLIIVENDLRFRRVADFFRRNVAALAAGCRQFGKMQIGKVLCGQKAARRMKTKRPPVFSFSPEPQRIHPVTAVAAFHPFPAQNVAGHLLRMIINSPGFQIFAHFGVGPGRIPMQRMSDFRIGIDQKNDFAAAHDILVERVGKHRRQTAGIKRQHNAYVLRDKRAAGGNFEHFVIFLQKRRQRSEGAAFSVRRKRQPRRKNADFDFPFFVQPV